ncbi:MAG TPA: hypothetical protein VFE62_19295 [Gemmataceae bacterium]|nr:hypothetical protein [Gemmataceae bacterium]
MNSKQFFGLAMLLCVSGALHAQPIANDGLPPRGFLRIGTSKLRHGDRIQCLAYSPNGAMLVAGGGNDPVRVWNPKTGELMHQINEPGANALAFTPSSDTLLIAGSQRKIRFWNFDQKKETGVLEGHEATIKAIAVSPDLSTIVSGSQDGAVIIWMMQTKRPFGPTLKAHNGEVTAVAFTPDKESSFFVTASNDRTIKVWSIEGMSATVKTTLDAQCGVLALAFSADGKTLYSAGDDNLIRRWDFPSGKQSGTFKGHEDIVVSVAVRGDMLISSGFDKTIRFWDAKTTALKRTLPTSQGNCDAFAITSAADFFATGGTSNTIRIFEAGNGKEVAFAPGPQSGLAGMALSPDNKRVASVTSEGQVQVYSTDGKLITKWDSKQIGDVQIAFTPDGKALVTADNDIRFWNIETGAQIGQVPAAGLDTVQAFAFSPDSKTIAIARRSAQIELVDWQNKKSLVTLKYPGLLYAVAWSPDGKKIAAGGGAKIFLWDSQGNLIRSFDVKEGPAPTFPTVRLLAFGPDNKTLAAAGFDAVVRIFDCTAKNPTDAKDQRLCEGHTSAICSLAFSGDGRMLLTGGFDRTARLWEAFSGRQIALCKGHVGPVTGVGLARDSRSFYSGSADTTIFAWNVPGIATNGKLPEVTLSYQEIEKAWDTLSSEETSQAHDVLWRCIASSKQAVPHLTKYLHTDDPERIKKLFKDLDSGHYPTRIAAQNELAKKGRWMEGRYDAAIANPPSLEYKRRVEVLKEKLNSQDSPSIARERLRVRRVMMICEQVGSPEAIAALQRLSDRGPEEELREEARASLDRLKKSPPP